MTSIAPAASFAAPSGASAEIDRLVNALRAAQQNILDARAALRAHDAAQVGKFFANNEERRARRPYFNAYVRSYSGVGGLVDDLLAAYNEAGGR